MRKVIGLMTNEMPFGVAINALAHMSAGFAARMIEEGKPVETRTLTDGMGGAHNSVAVEKLDVRLATSEQIRSFRTAALAADLSVVDFVQTMTGDTYAEQLERTKASSEEDLVYYGVMVAGDAEVVDGLA